MQKVWIIIFIILRIFPDIIRMRSVKTLSTNSTKYNTVTLSAICDMDLLSIVYDRENDTKLNAANNTENITELNTVHNMLLNLTNIEYENRTHHILPEINVSIQDLNKIWKKRTSVTQAIVRDTLVVVILMIVIIVCIKHNYMRINLYHLFRAAHEYYRQIRFRQYIMTPNDIEAGSIWDARQAYNNMLARRRTRQAMRMIRYYTVPQESKDENVEFNRNRQQRQTI